MPLSFASVFALLTAIGLTLPTPARAWGDDGHAIVALIARHHLSPAVRQKVDALLATDPSGLAPTDIAHQASWADRYRDSDRNTSRARYEQTRQWHFVNTDLSTPDLAAACFGLPPLPAGTLASNGPARDCVVGKVDQFAAELADPRTAPDERRLALQFLLHFVGDLHQPLHAADDHDAGGNGKLVRRANASGDASSDASADTTKKLHAFWDVDLVAALGADPAQVAARLTARISPAQAARWRQCDTRAWAVESFGVARRVAYGALPAPSEAGVYVLPLAYLRRGRDAVALQLSRAGVRLAAVLDRALR